MEHQKKKLTGSTCAFSFNFTYKHCVCILSLAYLIPLWLYEQTHGWVKCSFIGLFIIVNKHCSLFSVNPTYTIQLQ